MWKFPYMAGIYGGGAFLAMFLIFTIFVGLPLLIMEFTVGKMGRTYTTQIYSKLTGKKWLNIIGWNGNLAVFILFGFYSVIGHSADCHLHRTSFMAISYISTHQSSPRNQF